MNEQSDPARFLSEAEIETLAKLEKAAGYQQGKTGLYIDLHADSRYTDAAREAVPRLLAERAALRSALADCVGELQKESFGMRTRIRALLSGW